MSSSSTNSTAFIIDGARTPFGNFGGALKDQTPEDLGELVSGAALKRSGVDSGEIDQIIFGNVIPTDSNSIYLSRHIGLRAGFGVGTPALTVNRLCGSGLEAVAQAAGNIMLGQSQAALAGGVENMSQAPFLASGARWGNRLGSGTLDDMLLSGLTDNYIGLPMGGTAEVLAEKYSISREAQDEWAGISQRRAAAARDAGKLAEEIVPVILKSRKGEIEFKDDEFIRGAEGVGKLPSLKPAFKREGGTVTAGNASGINDGASAMIVASESFVNEKGLKPAAKILGWASRGCEPRSNGHRPGPRYPRRSTNGRADARGYGPRGSQRSLRRPVPGRTKTTGAGPG